MKSKAELFHQINEYYHYQNDKILAKHLNDIEYNTIIIGKLKNKICEKLELNTDKLFTDRRHKYSKGRRILAYILYNIFNLTPNEVADFVNMDRTQVYWSWRKVHEEASKSPRINDIILYAEQLKQQ